MQIKHRSVFFCACFIAALSTLAFASNWKKGDSFPVSSIDNDATMADATIVAFMPSATADCEYASMLTQSFYYYFDQKLAFENLAVKPNVRVVLVVGDRDEPSKSMLNKYGEMKVVFDPNGEHFKSLSVSRTAEKNGDSTVILLDRDNRVALVDEHYRAQGEHLKPLEHALRQLVGIDLKLDSKATSKPLLVGQKAPDFRINEREMLSDLRGSVVLVSFYPAAFSGVIPRPSESLSLLSKSSKPIVLNDVSTISCVVQIEGIELTAKQDARRVVVSSSTPSLLEKWRELLGTTKVEYANDPDYAVARKYASLDPLGFHRRVSVIVGRDGLVRYVDMDFEKSDEALIESKIEGLLK